MYLSSLFLTMASATPEAQRASFQRYLLGAFLQEPLSQDSFLGPDL